MNSWFITKGGGIATDKLSIVVVLVLKNLILLILFYPLVGKFKSCYTKKYNKNVLKLVPE